MTHVQWFLRLLVFSIFSSVRNMTCFRESIRSEFSGKMRVQRQNERQEGGLRATAVVVSVSEF